MPVIDVPTDQLIDQPGRQQRAKQALNVFGVGGLAHAVHLHLNEGREPRREPPFAAEHAERHTVVSRFDPFLGPEGIPVGRIRPLVVLLVVQLAHCATTATFDGAPHRVIVTPQDVFALCSPPTSPGVAVASHTVHSVWSLCR